MKLNLHIYFILFILCIFFAELFALEKRKIKYQVEVSLDLTETASKKILSHYPFEIYNRIDYVFDMYDGKNFLLFPSKQKTRFRLKEEKSKRIVQINTNTKGFPKVCEDGNKFLIRERKTGEMSISNEVYKTLLNGNNLIEQLNENPNNSYIPLLQFNDQLIKLKLPFQRDLEKSFENKKWIYLPINITQKTKWKKEIELESGNVTLSISQGMDFIGDTFLQEKWELEFQIDPVNWKNVNCKLKYCDLEMYICDFLKKEDITNSDLNPTKISPYTQLEQIIKPHLSQLGF